MEVGIRCHACGMDTVVLTAAERDALYTEPHRRRKAALLQDRVDSIVRRRRMVRLANRSADYAERAAHDYKDD